MTGIPHQDITPITPVINVTIPEHNEALNNELTQLAGHINAAQYRFLKLLAALIERGAWGGQGIKSPAHWLNYYCGISSGPAREKVRVAKCLQSLPLIDAAFSRGELSYSKVRAMTRTATPENEHYFLEIARFGTASHVEQLVRQHRRVKRFEANDQNQSRMFDYCYDDDGMLVFRGRLRGEDGAVLMKAMQALMERRGAFKNIPAGTSLPGEQRDTFLQKRADALVQLAEHGLACDSEDTQAMNNRDKYQVMVHVHGNTAGPVPDSHIEGGPVLSPETVERLMCDTARVTALEDADGNLLNIGRKTRTIPPAIRRALQIRDKGCRFPGCCETKYVDAHHIHHWGQGGETSLDNLVLLCRFHHRLIHEEGYEIVKDDNNHLDFLDPKSNPLQPSLYPQFELKNVGFGSMRRSTAYVRVGVPAGTFLEIERQHEALGLDITPETALTAWQDEVIDVGTGVEALLRLDSSLPGST